jgi:PAS domain S-box-containing protein
MPSLLLNKSNPSQIIMTDHILTKSTNQSWEKTPYRKKGLSKGTETDNQQFYDLFLESPSAMGILSGPDHIFQVANPEYLNLIDQKGILGKPFRKVLPETVHQGFIKVLDKVYKTGHTFSAKEVFVTLRSKNKKTKNHYLDFVQKAHRDNEGKIIGVLFFVVDVTEKVLARLNIENNKQKLNEAQNIGRIGSFEMDLATNQVSWSDEKFNQLGLKKGEVIPSSELFLSFIHPDDSVSINESYKQVFKTLKDSSNAYRIVLRDGSVRHVYTKWRFEFDSRQRPVRMYGITQDITEQKLAEIEIKNLNETLESRVKERTNELLISNQELETFNHSISHDLQIPLRAIDMFAHALRENCSNTLSADGMFYLKSIDRSITDMTQLIEGLLNFSKLNKIDLVKNEVNMHKLVKTIIDEVKYNREATVPEIVVNKIHNSVCDHFLVKQVWMNLISNAIKYSSKKEHPVILIGSNQVDGELVYYIKDNGVGFNIKYAHKLFDVFERLHSSNEFEGTGIGLSNVQRIINRHGGRIWAEAEEDKGATFYFTLT